MSMGAEDFKIWLLEVLVGAAKTSWDIYIRYQLVTHI